MKKIKRYMASLTAFAAVFSLFSCQNNAKKSTVNKDLDPKIREELNDIVSNEELLTGELENKKIKWMATWDINPGPTGKNVPIELALFQERYGGEIEYYAVTWENRYDKLAVAIQSGEGIDFFSASDSDAFPKGAKGMFAPIDDYIDFDSPLWSDVKDVNDSIMWNGNHYVAVVFVTGDNCAVIYNRDTIEEACLEDPAVLYEQGNWTWDTFEDMLIKFVDKDNKKFGIDGWWFEFGLMSTTGVPPVTIENQKLVNNLGAPAMERVQNYLYELYNKDCIAICTESFGSKDMPNYIGEGKTLFYPCGLYQFYCEPEQWQKKFGENAFFVPMPKDPEADEYYVPTGMDAFVMVKGGQNPEGVAKYLDCKRYTLLNDKVRSIADEQMVEDYGWSQDMIDMKDSMQSLAEENPVYDFSKGVSADCGEILDINLRNCARGICPWNETYDSIFSAVDQIIKEVNEGSVSGK